MGINLEKIVLADHYGFCMGVKRAIKIAEETGNSKSEPVNVINEIVHNDSVVEELSQNGVGYVRSVDEAPGGTVIVSAHGQPRSLFEQAKKKGLKVVDATCPLVIRIHEIVKEQVEQGREVIHFGDWHHDETLGVVGHAPQGRVVVISKIEELSNIKIEGHKFALTAQTTAGVEDFSKFSREARKLIPEIEIFNTICNATCQRQEAVMKLAPHVDVIFVVGSTSSANSKRLRLISEEICGRAYLINSVQSLQPSWLEDVAIVGLTAGASTPEFLVEEVITKLLDLSGGETEVIRPQEK